MQISKIIVAVVAGLMSFSVWAADVPAKSLPMSTIISNLEKQGYSGISEIKFKDNAYEVEAHDKQGKEIKAMINPETGNITQTNKSTMTLTMQEAVKKVESAGYHSIYFVEMESDGYKVKGLDKDGSKVSLEVDGKSGEISKNIL